MPTLVASYPVYDVSTDTASLVTPSFTPAAGEILVIKGITAARSQTMSTPAGGGLTYTLRKSDTTASHVAAYIWTAPVTVSSPMTVTVAVSGSSVPHSIVVERWSSAKLAATPATCDTTGTGAPSTTITTVAANSQVSWLNGDWTAVNGASRTYNTTSATPAEDGYTTTTGQYTAYYATQAAATAGSQTLGVTAPTGQTWTLLGIEIEDSQGPNLVQTAVNGAASGGAVTVTLPGATSTGNCLAVAIYALGSTSNPTSISGVTLGGVAGNFSSRVVVGAGATANPMCAGWVCENIAGGQTSVVISTAGGVGTVGVIAFVYEVSGIATGAGAATDKSSPGFSGTGSTAFSSGATGTTSSPTEFWVGIGGYAAGGVPTLTGPASPWTNLAVTTEVIAGIDTGAVSGSQITTSTGTATYSGTISSSEVWAACVLTLLPAAAATPAPFYPQRSPAGRSRPVLLRKGTAKGSAGTPVTVVATTPAPFTALRGPVRRLQQQRKGTAKGGAGAPVVFVPPTPAPFIPLHRPAPFTRVVRRGVPKGAPGTPVTLSVPAPFTPLHRPPWAPRVPRRGTAKGAAGTPVTQVAINVVNTWTNSRNINGPGFGYGAPAIGSVDCPVASSAGNWLIAFCSWTMTTGLQGATMAVDDDTHGYWIPLGAPNGDSSVNGFTRCSIWARPAGPSVPKSDIPVTSITVSPSTVGYTGSGSPQGAM